MLEINYLEWIGYIGSIIVAISLTMTSMVKLRWLNFVGALIFTVYGVAINAFPVALVNGFITIIDVYFLVKMYTTKDYFTIQEINADSAYLDQFVQFYKEAIPKDFPNFKRGNNEDKLALLVLRNMQVAGIFIGKKDKDNILEIELDFATPQYRDFKTGDYLFNKNAHLFTDLGFSQLIVNPFSKSQMKYYPKVGFIQQEGSTLFTKEL